MVPSGKRGKAESAKTAPEGKNHHKSVGSLTVEASFSGRRGISSAHMFLQRCVVSDPVTVAVMGSLALTTAGPG